MDSFEITHQRVMNCKDFGPDCNRTTHPHFYYGKLNGNTAYVMSAHEYDVGIVTLHLKQVSGEYFKDITQLNPTPIRSAWDEALAAAISKTKQAEFEAGSAGTVWEMQPSPHNVCAAPPPLPGKPTAVTWSSRGGLRSLSRAEIDKGNVARL